MKHRIDPTVDCVFKAILGREDNQPALLHFLNAVLQGEGNPPIQAVTILNPYNEREFRDDKLTVVDVKAQDEKGNQYQIEIQLVLTQTLASRMLYTWSGIYHALLLKGESFEALRQVVSIWLLGDSFFPAVPDYHLPFAIYNLAHKLLLTDQFQLHLLQLSHWRWQGEVKQELDRWMYTFTEGKHVDVDHPPEILRTKEMNMVMETLRQFSENEENYLEYESRRIAQIQANTERLWKERTLAELKQIQAELERVKAERDTVKAEIDTVKTEREQTQEENERLRSLLKQAGLDPDSPSS